MAAWALLLGLVGALFGELVIVPRVHGRAGEASEAWTREDIAVALDEARTVCLSEGDEESAPVVGRIIDQIADILLQRDL